MFAQSSNARRGGVSDLTPVTLPGGRSLPVAIRRSHRARRILLSVKPIDGAVELVVPYGVPLAEGIAFVVAKTDWIAARTAAAPGRLPFAEGRVIPWLGRDLQICQSSARRATPWRVDDTLFVPGRPEELSGRVGRWLRAAARAEIAPRVADKAAQLGRSYRRIAIRDVRTRWGSCSARGNLSFCWRLVLAPEPVLNYVVAHEVAHLAELNHSARFWAHVAELCEDPAASRAWLKVNGPILHRYG